MPAGPNVEREGNLLIISDHPASIIRSLKVSEAFWGAPTAINIVDKGAWYLYQDP